MAYVIVPFQSVKLKASAHPEIQNLYDFALQNDFDEFTTLSHIKKKIKESFAMPEIDFNQYSKILNGFSFFDKSNYDIEDGITDIYEISNLLNQIKEEVLYYFDPATPKEFSGYILKRLVSPPLEAFQMVGNNKLNFKPSGRDYGLLFE